MELNENSQGVLVIENPECFCEIVGDLLKGIAGEDAGIVLSENNIPLKLDNHLECILNPLALSLNDRKLLNRLYEKIKKEIQNSELLVENNKVFAIIEQYIDRIIQNMDWELQYTNTAEMIDLLKLMNIRFVENYDVLLERIIDYINVAHDLFSIQCFVFVNLNSYLKQDDMQELFKFAQYHKLYILLIENRFPQMIDDYFPVIVVDADGCIIELDMS